MPLQWPPQCDPSFWPPWSSLSHGEQRPAFHSSTLRRTCPRDQEQPSLRRRQQYPDIVDADRGQHCSGLSSARPGLGQAQRPHNHLTDSVERIHPAYVYPARHRRSRVLQVNINGPPLVEGAVGVTSTNWVVATAKEMAYSPVFYLMLQSKPETGLQFEGQSHYFNITRRAGAANPPTQSASPLAGSSNSSSSSSSSSAAGLLPLSPHARSSSAVAPEVDAHLGQQEDCVRRWEE